MYSMVEFQMAPGTLFLMSALQRNVIAAIFKVDVVFDDHLTLQRYLERKAILCIVCYSNLYFIAMFSSMTVFKKLLEIGCFL